MSAMDGEVFDIAKNFSSHDGHHSDIVVVAYTNDDIFHAVVTL
jgi:predicted heme/steroid binding protein